MDIIDIKHPPRFGGSDFSVYKEKVLLWSETTDIPKERQASLLLLNCYDKAGDLISSIDKAKLKLENGVSYFLDFVQALYGDVDNLRKLIAVYAKYRNLVRGNSTSTEYIGEFLKVKSEMHSLQITSDMAAAFHLITGADMSDTEYSQFLTIVSSKGIDYSLEVIANQIKQVVSVSHPIQPDSHVTVHAVQKGSYKSYSDRKGKGMSGKGKGSRYYNQHERFQSYDSNSQNRFRSHSPRFVHSPRNTTAYRAYDSFSGSGYGGYFQPKSRGKRKGKGRQSYVYPTQSVGTDPAQSTAQSTSIDPNFSSTTFPQASAMPPVSNPPMFQYDMPPPHFQ